MFLPRIIPVLLLKNTGLVKTTKFKKPNYIGDPINAVRIFNDLQADELVFLDITATKENRKINLELVKKIGDEAFMPFGVGGGIGSVEDANNIFSAGAEKVIVNSAVINNAALISKLANEFGSQSIVVSIDIKKIIFNKYRVYIKSGSYKTDLEPVQHALNMQDQGAGELIINSIDNDGMMKGYDLNLIKAISSRLSIPVVALGGAGKLQDLVDVIKNGKAHAAAAGSMLIYHGNRKAVLINYPSKQEFAELFNA